jgi:hypothetical protein
VLQPRGIRRNEKRVVVGVLVYLANRVVETRVDLQNKFQTPNSKGARLAEW